MTDQTWHEFLRELDHARAIPLGPTIEHRSTDGDSDTLGMMTGHLSVFDTWYEIDSLWEGRFLERTAPGAFLKTIAEQRRNMRVLFNHGMDPSIGEQVLGPIVDLREDGRGVYYEVPLFDTSYNRDLLPGLRSDPSVYGSSFRFRVVKDEWDDEPRRSDYNPDGIPERTIREVRMFEFGPVTFPANPDATAGVRSLTDRLYQRLRQTDPQQHDSLLARSREVRTPDPSAAPTGTAVEGAAPTADGEPPTVALDRAQAARRQQWRRLTNQHITQSQEDNA